MNRLTRIQLILPALIGCYLVLISVTNLSAQSDDPFDLSDSDYSSFLDGNTEEDDQYKSSDELVTEAFRLQHEDRLLDARTKLLKAIQKDPQNYKAYLALADYYQQHVGHFRLAMKYIIQANKLFKAEFGAPPYHSLYAQQIHMDSLQLLSQIRLNLDNYQGALDTLTEIESYGYYSEWIPASKAWILMKLGRLDEAIQVARMGALLGSNIGPTQNILGILLSMKGEREASLKVFEQAINYELALGDLGRPATPLNNMGEVLKELFEDNKAKRSWVKATMLPDGCEHVLPSLNLALLRITAADFSGAKKAMDRFEDCVAQYPLRNGEEHKALVNLARGRIAMHTGSLDQALNYFQEAEKGQQWFGKIGTNLEDLQVAVITSKAQALIYKNNIILNKPNSSWLDWMQDFKSYYLNKVEIWWLLRKAREITNEELNDLEDLYIRHTDSMLEYETLGTMLAGFPTGVLQARVNKELESDHRSLASIYYQGYLGENLVAHGNIDKGLEYLHKSRKSARADEDRLFRIHLGALIAKNSSITEENKLTTEIFLASQTAPRLYGLKLPVRVSGTDSDINAALVASNFHIDNSASIPYRIKYFAQDKRHKLQFDSTDSNVRSVTVVANTIEEAVEQLSKNLFKYNLN